MTPEALPHILEGIEWDKIIAFFRKIIGHGSEHIGKENVSLDAPRPLEEYDREGEAVPPEGDEVARADALFFWQELEGLQPDIETLVEDLKTGVAYDIKSELALGEKLAVKLDALLDKFDPENPFLADSQWERDQIADTQEELNMRLEHLKELKEQLESGTLTPGEERDVIKLMEHDKQELIKKLNSIKYFNSVQKA